MLRSFLFGAVLTVFIIQLVFVEQMEAKPRRKRPTNATAFNHYVFALNTKEGLCNTTKKCPSNFARTHSKWTIHGLWPSGNSTADSPEMCPLKQKFSMDELGSLQNDLNEYWPSHFGNNTKFWIHQWSKHGSCAVNHTHITNATNYFNSTLSLYRRHNVTEYLRNDNIVPRAESYNTKAFFDAIKNDVDNKNVNVICKKSSNVSVVVEIRLCLSETDFQITDCPRKQSNCRKNLYYLPSKVPLNQTNGVDVKESEAH